VSTVVRHDPESGVVGTVDHELMARVEVRG